MTIRIDGSIGLLGIDGTATNPSLKGANTYTGIYFPTANTLAISTAATEAVRVDANGNVGIGTSTPSAKLDVVKAGGPSSIYTRSEGVTQLGAQRFTTDGAGPVLLLNKTRGIIASPTNVANNDIIGIVRFQAYGGTTNRNLTEISSGVSQYLSDSDISSYLSFNTSPVGSATSTERMRIDSAGKVGIGVSSPSAKLHIQGVSNTSVTNISNYSGIQIDGSIADTGITGIAFQSGGGGGAGIGLARGSSYDTNIMFYTNPSSTAVGGAMTERMRITSTGLVGIGTTNPSKKFVVSNSANGGIEFSPIGRSDETTAASLLAYNRGSSAFINMQYDANAHIFMIGTSEKMRVDSAGTVLIGTSSSITGSGTLQVVNASTESTQIRLRNSGAASGNHWRFGSDETNTVYIINHNSAGVYMGSGSTAWSALSDERSKDIIEPILSATEKVSTLRAIIGKYKSDNESTRRSFLIAQDVQAVFPEAVSIANQSTGLLGLSYTDLIPLLVAAIQELNAKVEALSKVN